MSGSDTQIGHFDSRSPLRGPKCPETHPNSDISVAADPCEARNVRNCQRAAELSHPQGGRSDPPVRPDLMGTFSMYAGADFPLSSWSAEGGRTEPLRRCRDAGPGPVRRVPVRLALDLDDGGVVKKAVHGGAGQQLVAEHCVPLVGGAV